MEAEIVNMAKTYFKETGETVSDEFLLLLVDSLVGDYKEKRNYPEYFTDQQINEDIEKYFGKKKTFFAIRVIPALVGKMGAEGQNSHSENGISRSWDKENWFNDVIPYCEVL